MITKSVVRKTLKKLRLEDLRQLALENGIDSREKSQGEIISVLLRGGGKDADVEVETVEDAVVEAEAVVEADDAKKKEAVVEADDATKKLVQALRNSPKFTEKLSFLTLLNLYRTTPEFSWLRPILAKRRAEELETLREWFASMYQNYSIE